MITFPSAKINIGLNVTSKRPDGYHNLETIFYPIKIKDALEVIEGSEMSFETSGINIPGDATENLCLKAYQLLRKDFDLPNIKIHLHKHIPIGAGLLFNKLFHGKSKWVDQAMPYVSMLGIAGVIAFVTAAGQESLLDIGFVLIGLMMIHNTLGYLLGYWSARALRMNERDSRTVAIEVGMQNAGLASGIAKEMGKIATVGLAPAVFAPLMNISGSILASYWHRRPPKTDAKK